MKTYKLRMKDKTIRIFPFFLLMLVLIQCTGPEGPMGNDGIDGINYTHSAIYDINPSEWEGDVNGYYTSLDVPEITEDIFYDGAVLVYRLIETDPKSFNMMPYTYVDNSLTVYMDFDAYVGSIELIYKEVFDGVNDTPAPKNVMSFKVVIIEGIPLAALKGMVDVSDYGAVAKMLNIEKSQNTIK
ncbi:MAG: hypothetical protein LLG13_10910 [Bacteroidales bacterium]|nr:hypothetical protein [Bacteroidales bacterium]